MTDGEPFASVNGPPIARLRVPTSGRLAETLHRLTEQKRASRKSFVNNHIAEHHHLTQHRIDWDNDQCPNSNINYFQRLISRTKSSTLTKSNAFRQMSKIAGTYMHNLI